MSDERLFELLSAAADGELSAAEEADLKRLLVSSPDAERYREELGRIDTILGQAPDLTPPESLHDRIMGSISLPSVRTVRRPVESGPGWFGSMTSFAALRYAAAAAAGLLLTVALYESRDVSDPLDIAELVGAMAPNRDGSASDVLDTFALHAEGINSRVSLERRNGMLLLDVRIDSEAPVDITVDLASAGTRLQALAQTQGTLDFIELSGRNLRMRAHGQRHVTVLLEHAADAAGQGRKTISLEFSSDGGLLQRGSLTAAW